MSRLSNKISKMFESKAKKLKKEEIAKEKGLPVWILEMPEGKEKEKAIRVYKANEEKKNEEFACGGVKFSKLKERIGKKK